MLTAEQIIEMFNMKPLHHEGGFYVETYRADENISKASLPNRYSKNKSLCTAIYYLLTPDTQSALHRLPTDEIFHFYLGNPVNMLQLHPDGTSKIITLGHDIAKGQQVQVIVPRDVWQGSVLIEGGRLALMGVTVAPGFDFSDYEKADRHNLITQYPEHKELITRLTL